MTCKGQKRGKLDNLHSINHLFRLLFHFFESFHMLKIVVPTVTTTTAINIVNKISVVSIYLSSSYDIMKVQGGRPPPLYYEAYLLWWASFSLASISKRSAWALFKRAWDLALSESTRLAWEACGLFFIRSIRSLS